MMIWKKGGVPQIHEKILIRYGITVCFLNQIQVVFKGIFWNLYLIPFNVDSSEQISMRSTHLRTILTEEFLKILSQCPYYFLFTYMIYQMGCLQIVTILPKILPFLRVNDTETSATTLHKMQGFWIM